MLFLFGEERGDPCGLAGQHEPHYLGQVVALLVGLVVVEVSQGVLELLVAVLGLHVSLGAVAGPVPLEELSHSHEGSIEVPVPLNTKHTSCLQNTVLLGNS